MLTPKKIQQKKYIYKIYFPPTNTCTRIQKTNRFIESKYGNKS